MTALLWTVLAMGILVLLLTLVSSVTLIGGLLARQRSTLGIVKALGGSKRRSFLALAPTVLLPALASLVPGGLLGWFLGRAYTRFAACRGEPDLSGTAGFLAAPL